VCEKYDLNDLKINMIKNDKTRDFETAKLWKITRKCIEWNKLHHSSANSYQLELTYYYSISIDSCLYKDNIVKQESGFVIANLPLHGSCTDFN